MKRRIFTALRLLVHWSTGAVLGSVVTVNHWNRWATAFLIVYIIGQLVAIPFNPYKNRR